MDAPAFAASNIYLELGPIKGESSDRSVAGGKIEVSSFQFGVTRKGWDGTIKGRAAGEESATAGAGGGGAGKVSMQDMNVTTNVAIPDPNSQRLAVSDPGASGPKTTSKRQHDSVTITKPVQSNAAGGVEGPLDRGSVTVNGSFPGCTVGAAYADAVLQTATMRYELKEVMISSCTISGSGGGGGGVPTDSLSLNYASYRESPTRASQK